MHGQSIVGDQPDGVSGVKVVHGHSTGVKVVHGQSTGVKVVHGQSTGVKVVHDQSTGVKVAMKHGCPRRYYICLIHCLREKYNFALCSLTGCHCFFRRNYMEDEPNNREV